jgi:exopolysaccharide biosynthesis polyprenyl glycosylphosphotransferase
MSRDVGARRRRGIVRLPRSGVRLRTDAPRLLPLVDALTLYAVLVGLALVRFGTQWPTYTLRTYLVAFALIAAVHLGVYYFGGLYEREQRLGVRPLLPRVATLSAVAALLVAGALLVVGRYPGGRIMLVWLLLVGSVVVTANRWAARVLRVQREGRPAVLLVGAPDDANLAQAHLAETDAAAVVAGHTTDARDLLSEVDRTGATDVLLLSGRALEEVYPEPLSTLERRGVGVLQRISARDTLLGLTGVREIAGMPFVGLRTHTLPASRARFKRILELVGLVVSAPLTLPVLVLVALYARVVAGPPVLFWQDRVGRDGTVFRMVKFRTMYPEAEEGIGPVLARRGDPRVVPACAWLRSSRLDELPQLWNVLRGQMSVVGPRPERPELTARYAELIPGYERRHEIPPGITGLAQVHGRYHTDPEYKLGHDLQYLVNWSPVLDLQILARTVWVVLSRRWA